MNKTLTSILLGTAILSNVSCDNKISKNVQSIHGIIINEKYVPQTIRSSLFGNKIVDSTYEIVVERFSSKKCYRVIINNDAVETKDQLKQKLYVGSSVVVQDSFGNPIRVEFPTNYSIEGVAYVTPKNITKDKN